MISSSQAITATARNSNPFAKCMVPIETGPLVVSTLSSRVVNAMRAASAAARARSNCCADRTNTPNSCGIRPAFACSATRSNATHASTTDPDAKLYRKGPGMEAKLAFLGHALMENHCGLLVDACLTPANGHAERIAALAMIEQRADRPVAVTLGADKGYDAADFVNELR